MVRQSKSVRPNFSLQMDKSFFITYDHRSIVICLSASDTAWSLRVPKNVSNARYEKISEIENKTF